MNNLLQKSLAIALLVIAGSISLYFLKIKPDQITQRDQQESYIKQQALDLERQKYEDEQLKEQSNKNSLTACLNIADADYSSFWDRECESQGLEKDCRLPFSSANRVEESREKNKEECFKKYKN